MVVFRVRQIEGIKDEWLVEGAVPSAGNDSFLLAAVSSRQAAEEIALLFNDLVQMTRRV